MRYNPQDEGSLKAVDLLSFRLNILWQLQNR
jgi:hypothetical protein